MASTLAAAVLAFSATSSSSVLSAMATSRAKISRNCRSLSLNARGSGLSTLNVPITRSCSMRGTVKRAAGAGGAFEVERIFARVFAQVALAGGGDEAGDAVAGRLGAELAIGRLGGHADGEHGLEDSRLRVEQANFDDVEMQHILRAVQDVGSSSSIRSSTDIFATSSGVRSASSMPAW